MMVSQTCEGQLFYFHNVCENAWYLFINSFNKCVFGADCSLAMVLDTWVKW